MKRYRRASAALVLAAAAASVLAACGSGSGNASQTRAHAGVTSSQSAGGWVEMVAGAYPGSFDPAADDTTQGAEVNWLVYTGLTTYRHADGVAGEELQPGLATALPVVSDGGRTYTVTLRPGLRFSNGATVRASDFAFAAERALRVPWPGSRQFLIGTVVGARAYAAGRAKSISGIRTDDAAGTIVIDLTEPDGAFDNVLAEPALGLIPAGSAPWREDGRQPPPGDGPYEVRNIVPGQSYSMVKNPDWKALPGIPAGHVNINTRVAGNLAADAEAVLNNTADIFDWADAVPARLLATIRAQAPHRFEVRDLGNETDYFFLNSQEPPFDDALARQAVVTGLDDRAYDRDSSGALAPACFPLPPVVAGHPAAECPYGTLGIGNLARARALLGRSGMRGRHVTVWSEAAQPRRSWAATFTRYLDQLGLAATLHVIADSRYLQTIGDRGLHPQAGVADWDQGFPNPVDLYGALLDGHAIRSSDNENYGEVDDPHINARITRPARDPDRAAPEERDAMAEARRIHGPPGLPRRLRVCEVHLLRIQPDGLPGARGEPHLRLGLHLLSVPIAVRARAGDTTRRRRRRLCARCEPPPNGSPHDHTIMGWPCREALWGETLAQARADYAGVANAIAAFEPVVVIANPGEQALQARSRCAAGVEIVELPLDDSWLRDCGPIYTLGDDGSRVAVHFAFNAWARGLRRMTATPPSARSSPSISATRSGRPTSCSRVDRSSPTVPGRCSRPSSACLTPTATRVSGEPRSRRR